MRVRCFSVSVQKGYGAGNIAPCEHIYFVLTLRGIYIYESTAYIGTIEIASC